VTDPRTKAELENDIRELHGAEPAELARRLVERGWTKAAAGPRDGWEAFLGPDGKRVPVKFAEAAAGPRTDPDLEDWDTGTYRGPEAAAGPRDAITLDELVLRKWADLARRLIAVAPTSALMDETGISAPHSTPPERQSIRAEADRIILRWLERDLALAKASDHD